LGIIKAVSNLDGPRASVPNIPPAVLESPSRAALVLSAARLQFTYAERTDDKRCHLNKGPHGIRAPDTQFPRDM